MRRKELAALELQALQQKLDRLTQLTQSLEETGREPAAEPNGMVVSVCRGEEQSS